MSIINVNRYQEQRELIRQDRARKILEKGLKKSVTRNINLAAVEASKAYAATGSTSAAIDAMVKHEQDIVKSLVPSYAVTVEKSVQYVKKSIEKKLYKYIEKKDDDDVTSSLIRDYINTRAFEQSKTIAATTRQSVRNAIQDGVLEGLSEREIGAMIMRATGGRVAEQRARLIARTETHAASQTAQYKTIKTLGVDMHKRWTATTDRRTREGHRDMLRHKDISESELFAVRSAKGRTDNMSHPSDSRGSAGNVINCRCVLTWHMPETDLSDKTYVTPTGVKIGRGKLTQNEIGMHNTAEWSQKGSKDILTVLEKSAPLKNVTYDVNDGSWYLTTTRTINLDEDNPVTSRHEFGHAIDSMVSTKKVYGNGEDSHNTYISRKYRKDLLDEGQELYGWDKILDQESNRFMAEYDFNNGYLTQEKAYLAAKENNLFTETEFKNLTGGTLKGYIKYLYKEHKKFEWVDMTKDIAAISSGFIGSESQGVGFLNGMYAYAKHMGTKDPKNAFKKDNILAIADMINSITEGQAAFGHGSEYFEENSRRATAEFFANYTALMSQEDYKKIMPVMKKYFPKSFNKMKKLYKDMAKAAKKGDIIASDI